MIHFKIKKSADESVEGDYQINYDDFVIGPKLGADLVIDDPSLQKPILLNHFRSFCCLADTVRMMMI